MAIAAFAFPLLLPGPPHESDDVQGDRSDRTVVGVNAPDPDRSQAFQLLSCLSTSLRMPGQPAAQLSLSQSPVCLIIA